MGRREGGSQDDCIGNRGIAVKTARGEELSVMRSKPCCGNCIKFSLHYGFTLNPSSTISPPNTDSPTPISKDERTSAGPRKLGRPRRNWDLESSKSPYRSPSHGIEPSLTSTGTQTISRLLPGINVIDTELLQHYLTVTYSSLSADLPIQALWRDSTI
ncbi:hypothetical protein K469DRAFT_715398 [Zopfia rhizophila CBS 207.26]|uniref:Uncharacterized protein n=1 Tax=Zopfia rhizophila CBS 207.26 TaxID=1314779 RepID=A0A6A6DQF7_9PEZI|nr:hypothetical protein K469DRAFT_715398 [Zopfia rhizophila CBS 207.26]